MKCYLALSLNKLTSNKQLILQTSYPQVNLRLRVKYFHDDLDSDDSGKRTKIIILTLKYIVVFVAYATTAWAWISIWRLFCQLLLRLFDCTEPRLLTVFRINFDQAILGGDVWRIHTQLLFSKYKQKPRHRDFNSCTLLGHAADQTITEGKNVTLWSRIPYFIFGILLTLKSVKMVKFLPDLEQIKFVSNRKKLRHNNACW